MILDMNIKLDGITKEFLEDLDELIEDTRVEYFIINPDSKEEVQTVQQLCNDNKRFKYTLPARSIELQDNNCVAIKIENKEELEVKSELPFVIDSSILDVSFIEDLNNKDIQGVILNATQKDLAVHNFAYSLSKTSILKWEQKTIMNTDYNNLALQSDYPEQSYDNFVDTMLKDISDLTFRAEQTIAAGGTRTLLKIFKLL